jgi:tetratricopeptide (TPR) repeat protein
VIRQGFEVFPGDNRLFLAETNIYLTFNDTKKAQANLKKALELDPTNYTVSFALGTIYDNISNDTTKSVADREKAFSDAISTYENALKLNPEYFDGNYNLGALYVNKAASINDEANKLPLDESAKFEQLSKEATGYLLKALPYLEKAIQLQPNDANTLYTLKQIYTRNNQPDKVKELQEKINNLQK